MSKAPNIDPHSGSEHSYREVFQSVPGPLLVFDDENLRFLAVNRAAMECYGYSEAEFLAMVATDLVPPENATAWRENLAAARQSHEREVHWRHRRKDGTIIQVEVGAGKVLFQQRPAVVLWCADITGRKEEELRRLNAELERRVQDRTAQLEAANRELEAFSYSVSHDLRAPLRGILGFSEVLLERYSPRLDQRGQEFLRRACDASRHMDRLIDSLLQLSRVGRAELQWRGADLSRIAEDLLDELRRGEPHRRVVATVAPGLRAWGDERLLRIVLQNLLQNAWKFTSHRDKAVIDVGYEPCKSTFFVRDNGAGFDMAYASRLFGAFQRLHSASEFPGIGLGLAMVQRIVNRHGGRVWGEAAVDQGATFYFSLPQHEPVNCK